MLLNKYAITGPEGTEVVLIISQTIEGDQIIMSIERINEVHNGFNIQTIRLNEETFEELCELKYKHLFFKPKKKEEEEIKKDA